MRLSRRCATLPVLGALAVPLLVSLLTSPAAAQERRTLGRGDPETQVLGYYAAVLQFHAAGLPDRDGRLAVSAGASYLPFQASLKLAHWRSLAEKESLEERVPQLAFKWKL